MRNVNVIAMYFTTVFSQLFIFSEYKTHTQTCSNQCSLFASCFSSNRGDRLTPPPSGLGEGVTVGLALFLAGLPLNEGGVAEWVWLWSLLTGMESSGENLSILVGVVSNTRDL